MKAAAVSGGFETAAGQRPAAQDSRVSIRLREAMRECAAANVAGEKTWKLDVR